MVQKELLNNDVIEVLFIVFPHFKAFCKMVCKMRSKKKKCHVPFRFMMIDTSTEFIISKIWSTKKILRPFI